MGTLFLNQEDTWLQGLPEVGDRGGGHRHEVVKNREILPGFHRLHRDVKQTIEQGKTRRRTSLEVCRSSGYVIQLQ